MTAPTAPARVVTISERKMAYHEAGLGPTLLLLHGSGPGVTGMENFRDNIAAYSQHFRTIVLDLPGYGGSDPVEGPPDQASAKAVVAFMDALAIESASLLGNSFGGIVGARIAAQWPDRVAKLIMIGGLGFNLFAPFPNEGINLLSEFAEDPTRARMAQWLRSMVHDKAVVTDELIDRRLAQALEPKTLATTKMMYSRAAMQAMADFIAGPHALKSIEFLPQIQCPTLLTWGRDDRVSQLDRALLPMRLIPHCELHVFPNCGHWAMIERKKEFEATTLSFLLRD
jgi:pimeloyl-ACP methyl ester carboxylesterase